MAIASAIIITPHTAGRPLSSAIPLRGSDSALRYLAAAAVERQRGQHMLAAKPADHRCGQTRVGRVSACELPTNVPTSATK